MVTLKDIAERAQVSATTVSIIVNGKAEERNISKETTKKVLQIAKEMGYLPNSSARRLRANTPIKPTIAFYWPLDYRTNTMTSILMAINSEFINLEFDCELMIQTFRAGNLDKYSSAILNNNYNAIIIGATEEVDIKYLESIKPSMPIILLNRYSEEFSTVTTNNEELSYQLASLIEDRNIKDIAVVESKNIYQGSRMRMNYFYKACKEKNINIEKILYTENSLESGANLCKGLIDSDIKSKTLVCETDNIALGILSCLNKNKIRVPEDMKLISFGFLDDEWTSYSSPSLSVVSLPNEDMGRTAAIIAREKIKNSDLTPSHRVIEGKVNLRESF